MEKDIGKITKNDTTQIVLRIDDFADKRGFTIREFVTSERYTGFTKSGVRILAQDWAKFKEMINSVDDADMKESGEPEEQKQIDWEQPKEEEKKEEAKDEEKKEAPSKDELPDY